MELKLLKDDWFVSDWFVSDWWYLKFSAYIAIMSKVGALLMTGVGGSGTALAATYFSGAFNWYDIDLSNDLSEFKGEKVEGCVQNLFPGIKNNNDDISGITSAVGTNFFEADKDQHISGCLVINWEKGENSSKKWKGNFKFLWAVRQKNTGFVTFAKAKTETDKKLSWEGIVYKVNRTDEKHPWTKSEKQEIKADIKLGESDLESKFPKTNDSLKKLTESDKSFWGFVSDKNEINDICESSCDNINMTSSFKGYWEFTGSADTNDSQTTTLEGWTTGLSTWWDSLFAVDSGSSKWDMQTVVSNKKGIWVNKQIYKIPKKTDKPANS